FALHDALPTLVRGPPVRVETGLALAGALGRDSVEPTQTLDVVVDVVADAAGVHPLGLEQGPDRRVLVVDRRVVAFDLDELGHGPARDRFAFAALPVLDPTVRSVQRIGAVVLQGCGHDVRAGAQVRAGEFGELLRDRRPGLPIVAG